MQSDFLISWSSIEFLRAYDSKKTLRSPPNKMEKDNLKRFNFDGIRKAKYLLAQNNDRRSTKNSILVGKKFYKMIAYGYVRSNSRTMILNNHLIMVHKLVRSSKTRDQNATKNYGSSPSINFTTKE